MVALVHPAGSRTVKHASPLPVVDGLAPSYVWLPREAWPDTLSFLVARFPDVPESTWHRRMASGQVCTAAGRVLMPDAAFAGGECVFYYRDVGDEPRIPFDEVILYQDEYLLVVDKPHFLPVTPSGRFVRETLLVRLRARTGIDDLVPIHRLDRETAGVMLFSVSAHSRAAYQNLFRDKVVDKCYEALAPVSSHVFPLEYQSRLERAGQFFLTEEVAGEPNAQTRIELAEVRGDHALYRLYPVTGKKHQLRVHMHALGMPILNDTFYPVPVPPDAPDNFAAPLQLLARSIRFTDPVTQAVRTFSSQRTLG